MSSSQKGLLRLSDNVEFGWGARASIPRLLRGYGSRVLVVVDPFLATTSLFLEMIADIRASGIEVETYTEIAPELPVASLDAAAAAAIEFAPQSILGYGGGSALDTAKLVALLLAFGGPLSKYYGENAVPGPTVPIVAVPTTAGTGSEVTPVAVVSDPERELKVGVSSPYLIPRSAVVDPELTMAAPASVSAHSGIDALVHAVESYTAAPLVSSWATVQPVFVGANVLSAPLSIEAVRRIGRSLEKVVANPQDVDARVDMALGSLMAGMAFGSTGTHLSHALQYPIGALTHTPHGLGTGLMLPFVLEVCAPSISDQLVQIALALGIKRDTPDLAHAAIDRIASICSAIGLPKTLAELGIERSALPHIAELALQSERLVNIAPITVDHTVLMTILDAAYDGDRSRLRASTNAAI